jgi:Zn-dependent alcohol dehydrogenase
MSWKNSGQLSVFFLLACAGAVLNAVKSAAGQSIAVYGVGGSASPG